MKEIIRWVEKSKSDLEKAEILFDNKQYDGAVFYCQQAVEKAIKALILKNKKELKKIHDLVELGKSISLPENLLEYCKEITQSYIYSRYPDIEEPKNIKEIASKFINYSKEITKWIEERI